MEEFKVGDNIYVNGEMDGREFRDCFGTIRTISTSLNGERKTYLVQFPEDDEWYVFDYHLSRKPSTHREIELAGITKFWQENNIK
jgi:hypothetical protein